MSTADIAILCLIALPTIVGVFYGFLSIVFSLLSWAVALGISFKFAPYFSPMLENAIDAPILRVVLAFVGLFIVSLLIMNGISYFIVSLLGRSGLTIADRMLGLFSGMGFGLVMVTAIVFLAGFTPLPADDWWEAARLVEPFERISIWILQYLPESVTESHSYEQIEQTG